MGLVYVRIKKNGVKEMNKEGVIVKWCNTCSRTFHCEWPDENVCECWAPDFFAEAAIANGATIVELEQETEDGGC